ncbi:uncharacterized protein LOC143024014 [Oratosquilla oratoria]|uniref:uncharacterized protein LOC143024014 n=1 Tax=Oratosquilla oratoria TaxID=337810 RepID=UPI003F75D37A
MAKSKLKKSNSSGGENRANTNPEQSKLDEVGEMEKEVKRIGVAAFDERKSYVCDKCFTIWSDEVLDILFRGTDTVTVNSKITYGAVVRFFEWAKEHLEKYAYEAVETLLFRADIGDNLKFLQMENFDQELEMLLKEGEISCCSVFLLIYQPHEVVSKIIPENTCSISLKHHISLFGSKQSTESSPSPDSHESPCRESSPAEISSPSRKEIMGSDECESEGVDTEGASVPNVPESASMTGNPESTSVTDDPQSTPATDTPQSTSVTNDPQSTLITDAPQSTPVTDASQSTPITDAVQSIPFTDVPQSTPVIDASQSASVTDAHQSTPVTDAPQSTPVTGAPQSTNDTNAAQNTHATDTPQITHVTAESIAVADVCQSAPAANIPESTPVVDVPQSTSVAVVSESTSIKDIPEGAPAIDVFEGPPVSDVLEDTAGTDVPQGASVADVSHSAPVTGDQASPVQPSRVEDKQDSSISSPSLKKKQSEIMQSKDKVSDSDEEGKLKRGSLSIESKENKVKDNTEGQEIEKSSFSTEKVSKAPSPSPLGKESQSEEGKKDEIRGNDSAKSEVKVKGSVLSSAKLEVKEKESVSSSNIPEESLSQSTYDKESMMKSSNDQNEISSVNLSSNSISETESIVHKDGKGIQSLGNIEGSITQRGRRKLQTKITEKVQQTDEELLNSRAKRKTRSMSNVDSDGSSSLEGSQRVKKRKIETGPNKELGSDIVPLQLSAKKEEVRGGKKVSKAAEKSDKLKTRRSTAKVAQSPKEDNIQNIGNLEKVHKFKESEILSPVRGTNEKAESHSTYEKPYVTRAGDRIQRRQRSENLQNCIDREEIYSSFMERVENREKKTEKIENSKRKRMCDDSDEDFFTSKRIRFKNLHTSENIVQTQRKSKKSVVPKNIADLLTDTEDCDSDYELSSETDDDLELDKSSYREPTYKKREIKQENGGLIYTKALQSIKEFEAMYVKQLSFKDMGDLVVNVSTIDFSCFDGPQCTRRGITKEWLKSPTPKSVAVSNGMILELFEYLFKRMTVIKVLSVMFWLLRKLDSKLQTSNSKQVKDAVALVIKEFEAMDEDMFAVYKLMPFKPTNVRYITQTSIDMKNSTHIPYLTFANGEMLFLHNHLVLNPTNPDPLKFYDLIRSFMDLRNTVLLVPDSQTLVQIGESVRKEFYAQRLAGTEQEFVCKEWDCKKLFRTGKPPPLLTKVQVRDIVAHFMKWKNATKDNDGVVNSTKDLNHSIEGLFDKIIELRGIIMSSRFDKVGFCFQLYAKYCDIVFLQKNLKNGLEFLESYTGLDEILFFQSRRKLKSQCHTEYLCSGRSDDIWNEENINVSHLKSQISTLSNELNVHKDAAKHSEDKMKELVKNITHLKKGVGSKESQLVNEIAETSIILQAKKDRRKTSVTKDTKKKGKKLGVTSRVCSAIKDLVANDVPVDEIRHIIEVIMENIVGEEPCNVPDDDWIHKYVKELDTSCEME